MKTEPKVFSQQLEAWLKGKQPKTFYSLIQVVEDKSFAVVILFLMFVPALPLPTGGVTHIFEVITAILALELILGFKKIALPKFAAKMKLGKFLEGKAIPSMLKRIKWLEGKSSPRWKGLFTYPLIPRLLGLIILIFTITAFLSPPFSGLDTLPALGVVVVCLSIILDDAILLFAGILTGIAGMILSIGFGAVIIKLAHSLFN